MLPLEDKSQSLISESNSVITTRDDYLLELY